MGEHLVLITNKNYGRLYKNDNEKCSICEHTLIIGEKAIRKRATHGHQKWYHKKCFEGLLH